MVDIYSEWSGPCTAMQTALKKIKLEVNRDVDVNYDDDCLYWQKIKENTNQTNLIDREIISFENVELLNTLKKLSIKDSRELL